MPGSPVLAVAKFLTFIPTWVIVAYLTVAAVMAVTLLVQFLKNARVRHGDGNAWLVLLILFFPLAALSMCWPVTMPIAIHFFYKDRQQARESDMKERRGFPIEPTRRP